MPPQPGIALNAAPRDPVLDLGPGQSAAVPTVITRHVGVQLAELLALPAPGLPDQRQRIDHLLQPRAVMPLGHRSIGTEALILVAFEGSHLPARETLRKFAALPRQMESGEATR